MARTTPQAVDTSLDPAFNGVKPNTRNEGVVGAIIDSTYTSRRPEIINEPGGSTGMVQYSAGGSFGGDRNFTYNNNTKTLYLSGNIVLGGFVHGRITTNLFNLKIAGGSNGQQLTTDGTGNLTWQDPQQIVYGNSNVSSYLANYNGPLLANSLSVPDGTAYLANIVSAGTANIAVLNINQSGNLNLDVSQLHMTGGATGQILKTDGTGNVYWDETLGSQTSLTLGTSDITLDMGGNNGVSTGPFTTAPNVAGGFVNSNTTANALLTFTGTGSSNLSLYTDGSMFIGNVGDNSYGYDYNEPGWVVVERGVLLTDQSSSILFPDGTVQTTAYTGQQGGSSNYGNSNVASYLPSYSGDLSPTNVHVTTNTLLGDNSTPGSYHIYRDPNQVTLGATAGQLISINSSGISIGGTGGANIFGVAGANVNIGGGTTGSIKLHNGLTFSDGTVQTTAYTGQRGTQDLEIDGGNAFTVYTAELIIDGGGA